MRGREGPAEGIESYPDGAEATELYLRHLQSRELGLEDYIVRDVWRRFGKRSISSRLRGNLPPRLAICFASFSYRVCPSPPESNSLQTIKTLQ